MSAKFSKPLYITIILWLLAVVFVSNYNSNVPLEAHHNYRWFNYEVPNHVIDSINRYKQAPIVEHYFAISPPSHLTPEQWGQAQSASAKLKLDSQQGGYTSFPPGVMILGYFFSELFETVLPATPLDKQLQLFNFLLWYLSIVFLMMFFLRVQAPGSQNTLILVLSTLPSIFAVEPLHSHHTSLWGHQLYQVVLAATLLLFLGRNSQPGIVGLSLVCAFGLWVEWTAFLTAGIIQLILIYEYVNKRVSARSAITFFGILLTSSLLFLMYHHLLFGLDVYFSQMFGRFSARSFVEYYTWSQWFQNLLQSYRYWLLLIPISLFILVLKRKEIDKSLLFTIIVCALILIENVLMFEHSIVYTFDRLKWGVFISLLVFASLVVIQKSRAALLVTCIAFLVISIDSLNQYMHIYKPFW